MNRPSYPGKKSASARTNTVPVAQALQQHEAFAQFAPGIAQIAALAQQLRDALPPYLHSEVEPARLHNRVLVVLTRHNALAARLRHLEPSIIGQLQRRGWPIDAVRIRIRPLPGDMRPPAVKAARLSAVGLQCLSELGAQMEPSPLKDALLRMVAHHSEPK